MPTLGKRSGAKGPTAYFIDTPIEMFASPFEQFIRTYYDCKGLPKGIYGRYTLRPANIRKGIPAKYYDAYGVLGAMHLTDDFSTVPADMRTIKMMLDGCCPPALINAILGEEGTAD